MFIQEISNASANVTLVVSVAICYHMIFIASEWGPYMYVCVTVESSHSKAALF